VGVDITCVAGGRGPARYTVETMKAISMVCDPNDIFSLYSPFRKEIEGLPSYFIFKYLPVQSGMPWLNWILPMAVRRDKVDVMFFPANDFWLWRAAPAVVTLHDIAPVMQPSVFLSAWRDRLQNRLQMMSLSRIASSVITVSEFSANSIGSAFPRVAEKLRVIYNGLSEPFQLSEVKNISPLHYILFVGGFDRRKNLERLMQAYQLLRVRGRTEKLLLVGLEGQNKKLYYNIPEMIAAYNLQENVEIKSGVDDNQLVQLYGNARLLVLPSLIEGFGLPVLEAMACGCPVASSNAASLSEVGGDAALYFDPYNVQEIADCIERILINDGLRQDMIKKGYEQVKKFSWQKAGEQVYRILKKVAADEM